MAIGNNKIFQKFFQPYIFRKTKSNGIIRCSDRKAFLIVFLQGRHRVRRPHDRIIAELAAFAVFQRTVFGAILFLSRTLREFTVSAGRHDIISE